MQIHPTPQAPIPTAVPLPFLSLHGRPTPTPIAQLAPGFTTGPTPTGLLFNNLPYTGPHGQAYPGGQLIAWEGPYGTPDDRAPMGPSVPGKYGDRPVTGVGGGTGHVVGEPGGLHAVPEPGSWVLMGMGLVAVWVVCEYGRRSNNRRAIG
jgi:hypothetical protein